MKTRISYSGVSLYLRCPHMYYLQRVQGIQLAEDNRSRVFGIAFHKALEFWWSCSDPQQRYPVALESWEKASKGFNHVEKAVGRVLLRAYTALYRDQAPSRSVETRKVVPMLGPDGEASEEMELVGVLDVADPMVDHKTTMKKLGPDDPYMQELGINLQATTYLIIAEDSGMDQQSILWDVIRAPILRKLRKKTPADKQEFYKKDGKYGKKGDPKPGTYLRDETPAEFEERFAAEVQADPTVWLQRATITRTQEQVSAARYDLWSAGTLMRASQEKGAYPRNRAACIHDNKSRCDYYPICHNSVDPSTSPLYTIRKRK